MTDQAPEQDQAPWDNEEQGQNWDGSAVQTANFPELPSNPHNHVYTWSPKLPDGSMLVLRANTAEALAEAAEALTAVSGRLAAAWRQVTGGGAPAPQAPAQGFPQPPQGPPFGPNVSVPAAPGYQGPPVPQMPQQQGWGGAQQGGFNGGGQQANRQGPKPRPNWPQVYKINVPYNGKDAFKAFREANKDALKGKVAWAGGGDYWISGDVVSGFAQYNPMAA